MNDKVDIAAKLATFDELYQPKIVGYYNDNKILVGKMKGRKKVLELISSRAAVEKREQVFELLAMPEVPARAAPPAD